MLARPKGSQPIGLYGSNARRGIPAITASIENKRGQALRSIRWYTGFRSMRVLLLHQPYSYPRFEQDFVNRIAELKEFDVVRANLEALDAGILASSLGPIQLSPYDAIVVFVAFKRLGAAAPLTWSGFSGLRVLMDHDIIQNYSDIFDPTLKGAWPLVFHRHRFDCVVTSGHAVQIRLQNDGVPADWVPKGFEPSRFVDRHGWRRGIATYGSAYACRQIAERCVCQSGLRLKRLPTTSYPKLGPLLNRFLGCMAISSDIDVPLDQRSSLQNLSPCKVPIKPGMEPMAKFFEAAGAGCCPIADAMEDLHELSFLDGQTMLSFRTHDELVEKLNAALRSPKSMRLMGSAASRLAHEFHTWAHRADALRRAINKRLN